MAVKVTSRNPIDSGGPLKLDVADMIDVVAPERETPLLRTMGWGASAEEIVSASIGANSLDTPFTSTTHTWLNDTLVPSSGTLGNSYTAAGGTITLTSPEGDYLRVNDVIMVTSANNVIGFYLVATVASATSITVTEISGQNHANGDTWTLIGNAQKIAGAANTTGKWTTLTQTSNFGQIFMEDAFVSGTEESIEQYGISDPMARETGKTFQRMIVAFERACLWGYRSTALPGAITTAIRMGGLYYYLRVASGQISTSLAGDSISEKALDDALDTIYRVGGTPNILMCNTVGFREFKKFNRAFTTTPRSEHTAGLVVDRYESAVGIDLDIVLNRHLGQGDFLILTKEMVKVGPLGGNGNVRSFKAREVPWDGSDQRHVNIRGEYTMEVKNHGTHHMWLYGGATSVTT